MASQGYLILGGYHSEHAPTFGRPVGGLLLPGAAPRGPEVVLVGQKSELGRTTPVSYPIHIHSFCGLSLIEAYRQS